MSVQHDPISRRIRASRRIDALTQARWLLLAAGIVVALILLWPRPSASTPEGITEIHLWVPNGARDRLRDALDAFEARHPQYRVVAGNSQLRDASGDPQRFLCGVAGGVGPDVLFFDRGAVAEWAARGMFLPLDGYIAREQAQYAQLQQQIASARAALDHAKHESDDTGVADLQKELEVLDHKVGQLVVPELFYPVCWREGSFQRPGDDRPRQWAIPNSTDARALYVVDDLLIRAGLVYSSSDPAVQAGQVVAGAVRPPRTWEDLCTKRLQGCGVWRGGRVLHCREVDFTAAGVRTREIVDGRIVCAGDHVALDYDGTPTLARVVRVAGPHELELQPMFDRPRAGDEETLNFKIYDADSYAIRLTEWDATGRIRVLGFSPMSVDYGNSYLHLFAWQAGGRFFTDEAQFDMTSPGSAGLPRSTLDDPRNVAALEWICDVYDALGGYEAVRGFESGYQRASTDPLLTGKVAMVIDLDGVQNDKIARYARDMAYTVVPAPMPKRELDRGREPITWSGGWAWVIPSTARHPDAAWLLIKALMSEDNQRMIGQIENDLQVSQGRLYIPRMSVRPRMNERQFQRYLLDNPHMPARLVASYRVFMGLLDRAYTPPISAAGQLLWDEANRAFERCVYYGRGHKGAAESLRMGRDRIDAVLDRVFAPPPGSRVDWRPFIGLYVGVIIMTCIVAAWVHRRRRYRVPGRRWYEGVVCALPWILGFLVFTGGPMLFSVVMSFTQYDVVNPAHWTGLDNFRELARDPLVATSLKNTAFMALSVPLALVVGLAMAMLLDAGVRGLAVYRTVYYLPAIVPVVAASVLWFWVFNVQDGLLNGLIARMGLEPLAARLLRPVGVDVPIKWLQSAITAKPALILMMLWGAGGSMLIWLAGLKGVPLHLYEAAAIDGAGPLRRFVHITLPMLSPYIFFNLVMGTIAVFQIFTQAYIMTQGGPNDATLFYAYHLFNQAFRMLRMGYAAAMAWVLFGIVMLLTLVNLVASKRWVYYESK